MEFDQDVQMEDVVENMSLNLNEQEGPDQLGNLPRTIPGELPAKSLDQLDVWIEKLSQCTPLAETDVESLCNMVSAITFYYCYSSAFFFFFFFFFLCKKKKKINPFLFFFQQAKKK